MMQKTLLSLVVGMLVLGATTTFANTNPDTQLLEQFS